MAATQPLWRDRLAEIPSRIGSIRLPKPSGRLEQDEEWCEVAIDGRLQRFRFHDYGEIYDVPGLYERLFYDRLGCCSPSRVVGLLCEALRENEASTTDLRVLDLGAGNGMVADELDARGADALVGIDIIPEARRAALRDRPGIYADYVVADLTHLEPSVAARLRAARLNCLAAVATLGFGDTPPRAFTTALRLMEVPGWLAFNIKETFLKEHDDSGFSRLIRQLASREVIRFEAYRRYRHRRSVAGEPLHYVAMVARLLREVPEDEELRI
jgi:predicted TPR repeat methyltransferase